MIKRIVFLAFRYLIATLLVGCIASRTVFAAEASNKHSASQPADIRLHDWPNSNTNFQPTHFASLDEWKKKRAWLREQVRFAAGLLPEPERTPLNAKIFGKLERDGYTIEKVYFESYPGFYVTGNLYRGTKHVNAQHSIPAVACPHGHWQHGRLEQSELGNIPARCIMLSKLGCTVLAYDMVGYNDSKRQIDHRINTPQRDLWGITSFGLQTWNGVRVLDFLQSLPEVDPERIGVTGASGGGTQTFILYAVDDRVKVACPVNMISHTMQGGCVCENAPCLRIDTNNMEIGAMMAPNSLLMISATGDWTKDTPTVEYPMIRSVYELYGAADKIASVQIDAPHNYNKQSREAMYHFFGKWLLHRPDADTIREDDIPIEKPEDLLVWDDVTAPKTLPTIEQLTEQRKTAIRKQIDALRPDSLDRYRTLSQLVRSGLNHCIGEGSSARTMTLRNERSSPSGFDYIFESQGHIVRASEIGALPHQHRKIKTTTLLFDPIDATPFATAEVLLLGPQIFGTRQNPESTTKPLRGSSMYFSTFNPTDDAEAISDALTTMTGAPVNDRECIAAWGRSGPLALVARALMTRVPERRLRTVIDMNGFDIDSDEAYLKHLNVPHIQRIGGLRAIAAVACNGPIWFHNVGEHFDEGWVKDAGKVNGVEVRVSKDKADEKAIAEWLANK